MKTKIYIASLVLFYLFPLHAQSPSEAEIERRENAATKLNSDANNLDRSYGYYLQARDVYFYGSAGIETQTHQFFQESLDWIDEWSKVLMLIDLSGTETLDRVVLKTQSAFESQAKKLADFKASANAISIKGETALRLLEQSKSLNGNVLPQYKDIIQAAIRNISVLQDAVIKSRRLALQRIVELERVNKLSYDASMGRLKSELIKTGKYPLDQSIAKFQDMINTQNIAGPILASLEKKENQLDEYVLNMAYFQAQDTYQSVRLDCQNARSKLSSLNSPFASNALNRVNQLCHAVNSHWQSISSLGLSKADLVFEYASFLGSSLTRECRNRNSALNCEKLGVLKSVGLSQLRKMTDDRLKFYEMEWANLEKKI